MSCLNMYVLFVCYRKQVQQMETHLKKYGEQYPLEQFKSDWVTDASL